MKWTDKLEKMFRSRRENGETSCGVSEKTQEATSKPLSVAPLPINFNLKALIVTDGHGCLSLEDISYCRNIDVCLLLGDLSLRDVEVVKERIGNTPVYGVLGNHDGFELYDMCGIENIHGKVVEINGVRIAGIGGSLKYKDSPMPLLTDEESIEIAEKMEAADILISHDSPKFLHGSNDFAHSGLQGITRYCEKYSVPLNIHGHHHDNGCLVLANGTRSIECYKAKILEISQNGIIII